MKKQILFLALSHKLTEDQIQDAKNSLGVEEIVLLSTELQGRASNVDPSDTKDEVSKLAWQIVYEAHTKGATHFCMQGEPCLAFWANLYASDLMTSYDDPEFDADRALICVQSTTKRESIEEEGEGGVVVKKTIFKHVQWRIIV